MKKVLITLAVLVAIAGAGVFMYREQIGAMLAFRRLKPEQPFAALTPPPPPDYADPSSWAALPDREDPADVVPSDDAQDRQSAAAVDAFFVHPTTYYRPDNWNQPLEETGANELTDMFVLRSQASVFNGCCKIHAPRYRQATLYSFMDGSGSGASALQLAYEDVERAFDYFIEHYNRGRPFILAAHSQGSVHVQTLLEKRISGTPLLQRLVAAYPIGFSIDAKAIAAAAPDVPLCQSPEQIRCFVTWNAVGPRARMFGNPRGNVCVNPLSWRADDVHVAHAQNLGGVSYPGTFEGRLADLQSLPREFIDAKPILERGVADARCVGGMLQITEIRSQLYAARPMGRDNYHIYDYNLFHMNLRENLDTRVARYLEQHPAADRSEAGGSVLEATK